MHVLSLCPVFYRCQMHGALRYNKVYNGACENGPFNTHAGGKSVGSAPGHSPSSSMQDLSMVTLGAMPTLLPYKLVHAQLLAEDGRVQDALAYCQVCVFVNCELRGECRK